VEDLRFEVKDGTIYGFLGPNGAGKTTTMNIMTGYLSPTEGEVIINGHDILEEPEAAKRTIGYLPETPPLYADLTVREYLSFVCGLKKVPKKQRSAEIRNVMDALNLSEAENRLIRNLSKGYRQRCGFAQALIGNPETLILDEPASGLDPKQIVEIRELIRELGKKHTVILSSHILSEVAEVCDRILIISEGRLVACDTPANLIGGGNGGRPTLRMIIRGTPDEVQAALEAVPEEIRRKANLQLKEAENGCTQVTVTFTDSEDYRGDLSSALYAGGCPVLEMYEEKTSLESVFLELTEQTEKSRTE
jgi:ABC-2 type transport system ATP-binding protein